MTRGIWALVALVVVLLPACGSDTAEERAELSRLGEGCLLDSDCPKSGEVCVFQRCHRECEITPDCKKFGFDTQCMKVVEQKVCQLNDEVSCSVLDPCPSPLVCKDNACRVECSSPADCTDGQQCVEDVCVEPDELVDGGLPPPALCTWDSDCGDGLVCLPSRECGVPCKTDKDCAKGELCVNQACVTPGTGPTTLPSHCKSGAKDGDESAVDCGGSCLPCPSGSDCGKAGDCTSQVCTGAKCQDPTCSDGVRNGSETGTDCGGPSCPACPAAQPCSAPSDCSTGICKSGVCVDPSCADGTLNGNETDIDCGGGGCPACDGAKGCIIGGDCTSGVCSGFSCAQPSCTDGVQNGNETAPDCGGSCKPCGAGAACALPSDCASGVCASNACAAASCSDSVKNGGETDVDCGGGDCPACASGKSCTQDGDCSTGSCAGNVCKATFKLTVTPAGGGAGSVKSDVGGIDCGATCSADVTQGTTVVLTATAASGSVFSGWSGGGCSGTGTCNVTVNADVSVTATFGGTATGSVVQSKTLMGSTPSTNSTSIVTVDGAGNFVTAGYFKSTVDFGGGPLQPVAEDGYIAKYSPSLAYVWARKLSGSGDQGVEQVVTEPGGDVIVVGRSAAATDVDLGGALQSCGSNALLLGRYASGTGQHVWSKCVGANVSGVRAVLLDGAGNFVIVGSLTGNTDLGTGTLTVQGSDIFLAVFSLSTGSTVSSKSFGGSGADYGMDLARTSSGWLLVGGCTGAVDFGGGKVTTAVSGEDICIARMNASFVPTWVKQVGGLLADRGWAAGFTPAGAPLVAAGFRDQVDFETGIADIAKGLDDIVLLRLNDTTGAIEWHKIFGDVDTENVQDLAVDPTTGAVTLAGHYKSNALSFGGANLPQNLYQSVFVAKLDAAGNHVFSTTYTGGNNPSVEGVFLNASGGAVYVAHHINYSTKLFVLAP